jgi:hypothetical protein
MLAYGHWWGVSIGSVYLVFALVEMYLLMPLKVCPDCPYYSLENSLCISGLNVVSRKLTRGGNIIKYVRTVLWVIDHRHLRLLCLWH